jgi:acetyl esterase
MIDPQARLLIDATNASPPLDQLGLDQARAWSAGRRRPEATPVQRVTDVGAAAGRPPLRVYHPDTSHPLPAIVFVHGGGWILGSLDSADETCRRIARYSGCAVVSVGYRLAPEHRHPAAVADVGRALDGLAALAGPEHLDVSRVALAGESSGAHIALAAAMARGGPSRRPGDAGISGLLLACPPVDRTLASASWQSYGDEFIPRRSQMSWMWDLYLGGHDKFLDGAPNPATDDLTGLPPAIVLVAEYDPLRDEGMALARRMRAAGVEVEVVEAAGQIHPVIGLAPFVDACDGYLEQAAKTLTTLLNNEGADREAR